MSKLTVLSAVAFLLLGAACAARPESVEARMKATAAKQPKTSYGAEPIKLNKDSISAVECGNYYNYDFVDDETSVTFDLTLDETYLVVITSCGDYYGAGVNALIDGSDSFETIEPYNCGDWGRQAFTYLTASEDVYTITLSRDADGIETYGDIGGSFYLDCFDMNPYVLADDYEFEEDLACGDSASKDLEYFDLDQLLYWTYDATYPFSQANSVAQTVTVTACGNNVNPFVSIFSFDEENYQVVPLGWSTKDATDSECTGYHFGTQATVDLEMGDYYIFVEGTDFDGVFELDVKCNDVGATTDDGDSASSLSLAVGAFVSSIMFALAW